jgi:hypothetical protein
MKAIGSLTKKNRKIKTITNNQVKRGRLGIKIRKRIIKTIQMIKVSKTT